MLIFYSQIKSPDLKDRARFERIKKRIAVNFRKMKKEYEKFDEGQVLIIKSGENWIAIHQFSQFYIGSDLFGGLT